MLVTTETARLRDCLSSIDAHRPTGVDVEVIVVANGTAPGELAWLDARDDVVVLLSAVNLGFGGGCNWAASEARGDHLVFMNDDAVATRGWLAALTSAASEDERIGVVGSRVLLSNGTLQEAGGVVWSDGTTSGIGRGMAPQPPPDAIPREVDFVSFCSTLVTRRAWESLGGFDEAFFPAYYEDTDLCLRAVELGWRVVCAPLSVVIHDEGSSSGPRFQRFLKQRNRRRFVERWSTFLATCEPAPSLTTGQQAVERALQRSVARSRRAGTVAAVVGADHRTPDENAALHRLLALQQEYIAYLDRELDGVGLGTVTRYRYRWLRGRLGRVLARNPWLSNKVRARVVSVGNRD